MRVASRNTAFTTREIAIVLLLLATVSGIVIQRVADSGVGAAGSACKRNMAAINMAIEKWYFDYGRWPDDDLSDIGRDRAYFPSGMPRCPVTGERYRIDPRTHRVVPHGHGRGPSGLSK